ncbi:hypothetical protein PDE_00710 [Penicillium oxalicum 114-2]|uniref:HIG1 domain-containing protein n=1 Tax=Penicillium oxalicum (strain 114-2 / CGMCC 5302) TaxID=933388 RepID=S7Z6L1_PENO1|nr:hypothetical protein PDE_00710 [Penicillium oxalicum 114-2]
MKLLTKEEEDAHYRNVVKGGTIGGIVGLMAGSAGVMLASRRYHTIRNLTIPMKAFLVTSSGTFVGIIAADHASREFEKQQNAAKMWYENREDRLHAEEMRGMSFTDRALAFARREKYKIVGATWVASMVGSFVLVSRNPYLSGQQKIVQARVYAQGLTLAVLCASAAFEISDQRRGRGILESAKKNKKTPAEDAAEPAPVHSEAHDQADLWKDMVAAEEQRLKSKHQSLHIKHDEHNGDAEHKDDSKDESKNEDKENKKETSAEKKTEGDKKA